ncbi:MAG: sensor hybrid histidine kinase [Chthoniobacteraceae bacterium]|nr:sensor hybrid histidine kinase [Chthoniobacteraceae bacterium]
MPTFNETNGRILLIDDNRAIHDDFRKIFAAAAEASDHREEDAFFLEQSHVVSTPTLFELDSAYQGEEGILMLRRSLEKEAPYAMAFIDMRMPPGMDGIETTRKLWEIYPQLQVVICTAYSDHSWEEMVEKIGNSDRLLVLKKPFEVIEALQLAHALTRKWALSQALSRQLADFEGMVQERTRELAATNQQLRSEIAERQRAEAQIREQAALLDAAQDAILVRDLNDIVLYWNASAERLYGWTSAEALGARITDLVYKDITAFTEARRLVIEKGAWIGELLHKSKDGREITVEGHWTLVRDEQGQPKSILAINTDITNGKLLKAQLVRAQRIESLGTLAGGIAHDLNNMLSPITMAVDILKLRIVEQESLEVLEIIEASAMRGADMVRQVLYFAHGVAGERVAVQPKYLISEVKKIAAATFSKKLDLKTDIAPGLWNVLGDSTQIQQVVLNLCVNARDSMPEGGKIVISAANVTLDESYVSMNHDAKVGPYVLIEVRDTGTGIPDAVLDKIFDPFFTTKEIGKGTGLGLSTSLGIVKSHGGFIGVVSEAGKGTTFQVYLPAQAELHPLETGICTTELIHGNGEWVLVVDDELSIRTVTQHALEAFGYRVLTASEGVEAVALYAQRFTEIAVVLTDMMMPVMDGAATIVVLRKINPDVKIITTSGLKSNGSATGERSPFFLPKPFTAEALLRMLAQVLGSDKQSADKTTTQSDPALAA